MSCPQWFRLPWLRLGKIASRRSMPEYDLAWRIGSANGGTKRCCSAAIAASSNCFHPETPRGTASSRARNVSSGVDIGVRRRLGGPAEVAPGDRGELPEQSLELQ